MSRVMDVLAQKELYSVGPDQTATEVAHRMAELHVGAILVMQAGELKGIFSERDFLVRVIVEHRDPNQTLVRDVMTCNVVTIDESATIEEAMESMRIHNCRHLPITRDSRVVGFLSMRDVMNSPIFLRLGRRMRGPEGTPVGKLRRVNISNIVAYNADSRYASIVAGVPQNNIEDVRLSDIRIVYRGGGKKELADVQLPERETNYPEPSMFGETPAYGFFIRHVEGIEFNNVTVRYLTEELRPPFLLEDVTFAKFNNVTGYRKFEVPMFVLRNVSDFNTRGCISVPDMHVDRIVKQNF